MPAINSINSSNSNIGTSLTAQAQKTLSTAPAPGSTSPVATAAAITTALTSVLSSLGALSPAALTSSSVKSLTSSLPNSMSNTATNSANPSLTNIKATPVSDPIAASLAATPPGTGSSANTFTTSSMQAQVVPINFSPTSNTAATNLALQNPAQLNSVSARLGVSTPTNDTALAALAATAFVGATSLLTGSTPAATPSLVTSSFLTPVVVTPTISNQQANYIQTNSAILSSIPGASSLLAENWNSSYPLSASSTGSLISGIPGSTDPNIIAAISQLATGYCEDFATPSITAYASQQSLINTLMSVVLGGNLTALYSQFAACPSLFTPQTQSLTAGAIPALAAAGSAALAATIFSTPGMPGQISGIPGIVTTLAAQPVPEPGMSTSLGTIMTATNTPPATVFGAGSSNGMQIWNAQTINSCNAATMTSIIGADTVNLANAIMSL